MKFFNATIEEIKKECEDTYIVRVFPVETFPSFQAGQYVFITNPGYINPDESHPFSIASSPLEKKYLEFCIKTYGSWTQEFATLRKGDTVCVSEPMGRFVWDETVSHAVFLLGGIGISPVMSMLRYISQTEKFPKSITMLYGNRTPETIAYHQELREFQKRIPHFTIIHIFSHIPDNHPWNGYRGFITKEIIEKEVHLNQKPTFFFIGPPIFIQKMEATLTDLSVEREHMKKETLDFNPITSPH